MEMHYNAVVVSLTDENKKAFREVDAKKTIEGRRCQVFMPFDTEYKLLVKNINNKKRIRLEIDIDGTNVSGYGLVIDKNESSYIERFVDIDKKFKFVKAQGSGANEDVADPTNPENGIIKVRVYTEKQISPYINEYNRGVPLYTISDYPSVSFERNTINYSGNSVYLNTSMKSCSVDKHINNDQIGATIEGIKSYQKFGTTLWKGDDGVPIVFSFNLIGTPSKNKLEDDPEYQEYIRLKSKFGK